VFSGRMVKTSGGMRQNDLTLSYRGRVVSKKRSALASRQPWPRAVRQARVELGFTGFFPLGGRTPEGRAFLQRARAIHAAFKREPSLLKQEKVSANKSVVQEGKAKVQEEKAKVPEEKAKVQEEKAKVQEEKAKVQEEKARKMIDELKVEHISTKAEPCSTDDGVAQKQH